LDVDHVAAHPLVDPENLAEQMRQPEFDLGEFLHSSGLDLEEAQLYAAHCNRPPYGKIRPFIKRLYEACYIPGSALKGAIRTALLWKMVMENPGAWEMIDHYLTVIALRKKLYQLDFQMRHVSNFSKNELTLGMKRKEWKEGKKGKQILPFRAGFLLSFLPFLPAKSVKRFLKHAGYVSGGN